MDTLPCRRRSCSATADEMLLDDLLRLAAAAAVTPQVEHDLLGLRRCWHRPRWWSSARTWSSHSPAPNRYAGPASSWPASDADDEAIAAPSTIGAEARLPAARRRGCPRRQARRHLGRRGPLGRDAGLRRWLRGSGRDHAGRGRRLDRNRRGLRTMLIDGDPSAAASSLRWASSTTSAIPLARAAQRRRPGQRRALRAALPLVNGLAVLSWDRSDVTVLPPETMRSVLGAAQRSSDLVVLDLPRRADPAVEEGFVRATSTLLVVPRDVRSCAAAARLVARCARSPPTCEWSRGSRASTACRQSTSRITSRCRWQPSSARNGICRPRWTKAGSIPDHETVSDAPAAELLDLFGLHGSMAA